MAGMPPIHIGPLPAIPSQAAGIAPPNPWAQLAQAAGAFPQQQQDLEMRKLALNEAKRKDSTAKLQMLSQVLQAHPDKATDPGVVSAVKNIYKDLGMPAPITQQNVNPVTGTQTLGAMVPPKSVESVDVQSLIPKTDWAQAVSNDPTLATRVAAMEPEQRKIITSSYINVPPDVLQAPRVPTWQERDMALKTLNQDMASLSQSNLDPNMFVTMVQSMKPIFDTAGVNTDILLQDPKIYGNLTAKASAQVEELRKAGFLKGAQYDEAIARVGQIHSMEDLNKFREKYLAAQTSAIPQRLQQGWQNIQLRAGELAVHQQNAHTMLIRVQNGDLSQLAQLRQETSSLNGMANSLNNQLNGFRSQQAAYQLANRGATSADLATKINGISKQLDDVRSLQRQVEQMHPAAINKLMHNNGATFTVTGVNSGSSGKPFGGQDPKKGTTGTFDGKRAVQIGGHVYDASTGQLLQ